jgi:ABC-type molybdate transport system substrate-binding protein
MPQKTKCTLKPKILELATAFFGVITLSTAAHAATLNNYTLRILVPIAGSSCDTATTAYGHQFETATGIEVGSATCAVSTPDLYVLTINYAAAQPVDLYTANLGQATSDLDPEPYDGAGIYADSATCNADLAGQKTAFATNTGLNVFTAYCIQDSQGIGQYILTIEGFGQPKEKLYVFEAFMDTADAQSMSSARQLLTSAGATVVKQDGANLYYYSIAPTTAVKTNFGVFSSAQDCTSQIQAAQNILNAAGATKTEVVCVFDDPSTMLESIHLGTGLVTNDSLDAGQTYHSLQECLGDEARVDAYERSLQVKTLGEICVTDVDPNTYQMTVFRHY